MNARRRAGATGFTLVELLVVVAILAILAAMLLPVFARARNRARRTACLSNLRQLSSAMSMYVQDFDEVLPRWAYPGAAPCAMVWSQGLMPYHREINLYFCPAYGRPDPRGSPLEGSPYWGPTHAYLYDLVYASYGYNALYLDATKLAAVDRPTETVLLVDTVFPGQENRSWGYFGAFPPSAGGMGVATNRHNGGANVAFVDGHVKWLPRESLMADDSLWDLR